jgi:uroporphyrinogen-III decarboxylase
MKKSVEELYNERKRRVEDAIALRVPDRVPIWFQDLGFFPARYTGISYKEAMYDSKMLFSAYKKTIIDFEPDMYFNPGHAIHTPGDALEALGCKQIQWPGDGLPPDCTFQFVEDEYMKADEYDLLLEDPSDFVMRTFLPRIFRKLEVFGQLPPLKVLMMGYFAMPAIATVAAVPGFTEAFQAFYQAGQALLRHIAANAEFQKEMVEAGYPCSSGAITLAPFDLISDSLRGMKGTMLDMYRQPEKLLRLIDILTPMQINSPIALAKATGNPGVFIPLHRGADGFLSLKQFETFYWPSLKKLILTLIDNGLTPCPFFEGDYTMRLKYLAELPKGKVLGLFDGTDIYMVKEALGNTMCISGMMPLSLLQVGTPDSVRAYTKTLIDVLGKGGGFIMGPRCIMDEANPDLVKVWFDFTKEYGVCR